MARVAISDKLSGAILQEFGNARTAELKKLGLDTNAATHAVDLKSDNEAQELAELLTTGFFRSQGIEDLRHRIPLDVFPGDTLSWHIGYAGSPSGRFSDEQLVKLHQKTSITAHGLGYCQHRVPYPFNGGRKHTLYYDLIPQWMLDRVFAADNEVLKASIARWEASDRALQLLLRKHTTLNNLLREAPAVEPWVPKEYMHRVREAATPRTKAAAEAQLYEQPSEEALQALQVVSITSQL